MSTDIAIYNASVPDRMRYAEALAQASLLPAAYRAKPANVLLALEYGSALGIAPMVAIQGIHVIDGKPTASAGLIGALVRKAGHRLRVTGDDRSARCEIVRGDDADFTFVSEWTIARAQAAGLAGKQVWKNYPAAMLKARAITEAARDACPEALSGVNYTAEELGDDTAESYPQTDNGSNGAQGDPATAESAAHETADPVSDIEDAVVVEDSPAPAMDATREAMGLPPKDRGPRPPSEAQVELVAIRCSQALKGVGVPVTTATRCLLAGEYLQRGAYPESLKDLTAVEVKRFLDGDEDLSGFATTLVARGFYDAEIGAASTDGAA